MVECPRCGQTIQAAPRKQWKFGHFTVREYHCSSCDKAFNLYHGTRGAEFTIPKRRKK